MPQQLFLQNIIAFIWDFDKTLIPGYMQAPLFEHYKVNPKTFWKEVIVRLCISIKRRLNNCPSFNLRGFIHTPNVAISPENTVSQRCLTSLAITYPTTTR